MKAQTLNDYDIEHLYRYDTCQIVKKNVHFLSIPGHVVNQLKDFWPLQDCVLGHHWMTLKAVMQNEKHNC